jgi:1-acyl-sn-glycerol-3-phosphate acyltransferase
MYAPIDAEALNKYRMFAKMGFYPVEQNGSWRGAASFLKTSIAILEHGGTSLWITPEGRFVDVRDTSAEFTMGLSHLAFEATRRPSLATASAGSTQDQSSRRIWFVSAAVEYTFWEERLPELLVWFGRPLSTDDTAGMTKNEVHLELMRRMRAAQQELASASIKRDSSQFEILLGGTSGTFVVYDIWRRLKASLTGKKIRVDHSQKLSNEP